jgi:hypothetical protein
MSKGRLVIENKVRSPKYTRFVPILALLLVVLGCGGQVFLEEVSPENRAPQHSRDGHEMADPKKIIFTGHVTGDLLKEIFSHAYCLFFPLTLNDYPTVSPRRYGSFSGLWVFL